MTKGVSFFLSFQRRQWGHPSPKCPTDSSTATAQYTKSLWYSAIDFISTTVLACLQEPISSTLLQCCTREASSKWKQPHKLQCRSHANTVNLKLECIQKIEELLKNEKQTHSFSINNAFCTRRLPWMDTTDWLKLT